MGFLWRWLFALGLVSASYNPTEFNYIHWVQNYGSQNLSLAVLLGLILAVGYIIYLRATLRSIGLPGMILVLALFAALVWVLSDLGILELNNPDFTTWLGILALSLVLGIGLSWSIVRRHLSGQADVDDIDE